MIHCSDSSSEAVLPAQVEIILTFFIGFHQNGLYIDSISAISRRYFFSLSLFWFDVATSIPLSYVDIYYSKVLGFCVKLPVPVAILCLLHHTFS